MERRKVFDGTIFSSPCWTLTGLRWCTDTDRHMHLDYNLNLYSHKVSSWFIQQPDQVSRLPRGLMKMFLGGAEAALIKDPCLFTTTEGPCSPQLLLVSCSGWGELLLGLSTCGWVGVNRVSLSTGRLLSLPLGSNKFQQRSSEQMFSLPLLHSICLWIILLSHFCVQHVCSVCFSPVCVSLCVFQREALVYVRTRVSTQSYRSESLLIIDRRSWAHVPAQSVAKRGLLDVRDICDTDQLSSRRESHC